MGDFGLWWDGNGRWWIGNDDIKGQSIGIAYYDKDAFCPHQLSEMKWILQKGMVTGWYFAENDLDITCRCHFHSNSILQSQFYIKR